MHGTFWKGVRSGCPGLETLCRLWNIDTPPCLLFLSPLVVSPEGLRSAQMSQNEKPAVLAVRDTGERELGHCLRSSAEGRRVLGQCGSGPRKGEFTLGLGSPVGPPDMCSCSTTSQARTQQFGFPQLPKGVENLPRTQRGGKCLEKGLERGGEWPRPPRGWRITPRPLQDSGSPR